MDFSKKYDRPNPEEVANPISKLFFAWTVPFFKYGYTHDLEVKDLYNCAKSDLSGPLGDRIEQIWQHEVESAGKNHKPSLLRTIRRTFLKDYSLYGIGFLLPSALCKTLLPIVLAEYIRYYEDKPQDRTPAIGWALGTAVIIMGFLSTMFMHDGGLGNQRIGMRCRVAVCSLIYRKLLKLNRTSIAQVAVGKLVNLLSNDVQRFDYAAIFLHYIWIMPIQLGLSFFIMYRSVGLAALSGLGAIALQAIPLQGYLSKLQGRYRGQIAQKTDNRVKLMNEITAGIQVIKMYAWEKPFEKVVALARKYEIDMVSKTSYIKGFSTALMVFTERVTLYLTLITFVLMGNTLTGDVVFSVAQLFNAIQLFMSILYPLGVAGYAEAKTSVKRIEEFLMLEERDGLENAQEPKGSIKLEKACASWTPKGIVSTLVDLDLDIPPGCMCCVVGSVGSGKSSFLQLLLKEMALVSGKVTVGGSVSYASQEPWLFESTVRNNILFGLEYERNRYREVVRVCALDKDIKQLPNGDKTLVGERGASLSGGQRARVNLARAVYRNADVYLLDDPLAAVDAQVARHLFERCFMESLKDKTRVLVTHQVQFLKRADLIIAMSNGMVEKIGKYSDFNQSHLENLAKQQSEEEEEEARPRLLSVMTATSALSDEPLDDEPQETQELMEKGAIPKSTYWQFFHSGGSIAFLVFVLLLFLVAQAATNAADIWLTHWTNMEVSAGRHRLNNFTRDLQTKDSTDCGENCTTSATPLTENSTITTTVLNNLSGFIEENATTISPLGLNLSKPNNLGNLPEPEYLSQNTYIVVYSILILCCIVITIARSLLFYKICMNASTRLHNLMFSNILQAKMRFFDTNPSGRILNRFSKDMGAVDELLPRAMLEATQIFLVMLGILAMVFIVTPWMIAVAVVLGVVFNWIRHAYLSTAQDVKRLEAITRAPVFSHVAATFYGLPTIRSSTGAQLMITREFDGLQDQHSSAWFLFVASSEAFGLFLDVISALFLAVVTFQFLVFESEDTLAGDVGLVISQSLILTGMLQHGVRQTAEVTSNMTSVERVLQYTKLDKEGPFESVQKPAIGWPQKGRVVFKRVYLKYAEEEAPVLRNLNVEVEPAEKIGIVGRTGAGKSSLISALFRLSHIDGIIEIDSINTADVGLNDLRSNISIIPQEPVLFSNTLRYNLDPFGKCDDNTLWQALENVELKEIVNDLEQRVDEGGSNFSVGQRQLLCLARALVRNNKILVLDEATANVDPQTDALIQKTIRKNFTTCTVLTIAHRLNTIMDSDKVLVMDAGQIVEFDHPHTLLQNKEGFLSKMVRETGPAMEEKLKQVARDDFEAKHHPAEQ